MPPKKTAATKNQESALLKIVKTGPAKSSKEHNGDKSPSSSTTTTDSTPVAKGTKTKGRPKRESAKKALDTISLTATPGEELTTRLKLSKTSKSKKNPTHHTGDDDDDNDEDDYQDEDIEESNDDEDYDMPDATSDTAPPTTTTKRKTRDSYNSGVKKQSQYVKISDRPTQPPPEVTPELLSEIAKEYYKQDTPLVAFPWTNKGQPILKRGQVHPEARLMHNNAMTLEFAMKYKFYQTQLLFDTFHVNESAISKYQYEKMGEFPKNVSGVVEVSVGSEIFEVGVLGNDRESVVFGFDDETRGVFKKDECIGFPENESRRVGCVVDCQGLPLVSSWFDKTLEFDEVGKKYLFVSVVAEKTSSVDRQLSLLGTITYDSGLVVYEVDTKQQSAVAIKKMVVPFGAITVMKWLVSDNPHESLLACVCQDGIVRVLRVNDGFLKNDKGLYTKLATSSITIMVPDFNILSCDWTSPSTLLLGLNDGCIAEIDIRKPNEPFYVHPLGLMDIVCIASSYTDNLFKPNSEGYSRIVELSSGDLSSYLLDLDNLHVLAESVTSRFPLTNIQYSSLLNGFCFLDSSRYVRFHGKRDAQTNLGVQVQIDDIPCSLSLSDYLPISIVGYPNGGLRIFNFARRQNSPERPPPVFNSTVRIMKMDIDLSNSTNEYRLDLSYHYDTMDKEQLQASESMPTNNIYENGICVTSCSLRNSRESVGLLSCCYGNGLIVIEQLMSASPK